MITGPYPRTTSILIQDQKPGLAKGAILTWKFFVLGRIHYILTGQDGKNQRQK
jgi:hypothetical protein